jgi:hypothetical protein
MEVNGQLPAPTALLPGNTPVPIGQGLGGPQIRYERGSEEKICTSARNRTRIVQPIA